MNYFNTIIACLLSLSLHAQNDGDELFRPEILHEIRIECTNPGFLSDMAGGGFPGLYEYYLATAIIDGQMIDSIGIRVKGGLSTFADKKPLKIDFNLYRPSQKFDGLRKINLHTAYFDESMQREAISFDILRHTGLKTPRTANAKVFLNNEYQGVYNLFGQIDKTFLKNYFADNSGVMYKISSLTSGLVVESEQGTLAYHDELMATINNFTGDALVDTLDRILDTDAFLKNVATQVIINSTDNLISVDFNYYIYRDPKSGLLYYIPWDFNLAFFPWVNYPAEFVNEDTPPYIAKILDNPVYHARYLELLCEILSYNFTTERLFPLLDARKALITDAMTTDPLFEFTFEEFEAEQTIVKNWIIDRIAQLQEQLSDIGSPCSELVSPIDFQDVTINEIVASNDSISGIADPAGGYPDWIELHNNTNADISLSGYYLSHDKDFKKHWKFPADAVIPANDYLILWADRDVDEEGLHLDFKLDKDGGELFLIYENYTVIDSMSYGLQETNVSFARIPDGTGEFSIQASTFNMNNELIDNLDNEFSIIDWSIYPNPATETLFIQIPEGGSEQNIAISILDVYGRMLDSSTSHVFKVNHYPAGTYFIRLAMDDYTAVKKLVIN